MPRLYLAILLLSVVAACGQLPSVPTIISPYRIDIQQGNLLTQDMISKLKPGMTRAQVRFALGSPLVVDPFRTDRWDYVYSLDKQGKQTERRHVTVIFDGDKLLRIEGDVKTQAAVETPPAGVPNAKPIPAKDESLTRDNPAAPRSAGSTQAGGTASADAKTEQKSPAKSDTAGDAAPPAKGFFGRLRDKMGF